MSNRSLLPLAPFAENAETTIPAQPVPGVSYRDENFTGTADGWAFKQLVESQDFNQTLFNATSLIKQVSDQGILDYSASIDYSATTGAVVKDAGGVYVCLQDNGPSSTVAQPSNGLPYWTRIDIGEVSPLNNQWNGFFDPAHQSQLPSPAGYPDPGGTAYSAGDEWSIGNFASGGTITSSTTGITFTVGTYKEFEYTTEQLANIDVNKVPVYLVDETGKRHFLTNATNGVNVTKPDSTTLKVELTNAIFAELGIAKLWRLFVTERVGRVEEVSPNEVEFRTRGYLLIENVNGRAEIYRDGKVVQYGQVAAVNGNANVTLVQPITTIALSSIKFTSRVASQPATLNDTHLNELVDSSVTNSGFRIQQLRFDGSLGQEALNWYCEGSL